MKFSSLVFSVVFVALGTLNAHADRRRPAPGPASIDSLVGSFAIFYCQYDKENTEHPEEQFSPVGTAVTVAKTADATLELKSSVLGPEDVTFSGINAGPTNSTEPNGEGGVSVHSSESFTTDLGVFFTDSLTSRPNNSTVDQSLETHELSIAQNDLSFSMLSSWTSQHNSNQPSGHKDGWYCRAHKSSSAVRPTLVHPR